MKSRPRSALRAAAASIRVAGPLRPLPERGTAAVSVAYERCESLFSVGPGWQVKQPNVRGGMSVPIAVAIAITLLGAGVAYSMATKVPKPRPTPVAVPSEIQVEVR